MKRLTLLSLALALGGCLDPGEPGNLVPKTVVEDRSLPRIEIAGAQLHAEAFGSDDAVVWNDQVFTYDWLRQRVVHWVDEIRHQIGEGRGFVVVRCLPVEAYSKDDLAMIFWGIGTHLGRGLSQSVRGDRLGHVKDFSREDPLARAYRNKQELSPHTDSCDLVGLFCLRAAQSGGVSRLTSV